MTTWKPKSEGLENDGKSLQELYFILPFLKLAVRPPRLVVPRLLSFWKVLCSEVMLVSGNVYNCNRISRHTVDGRNPGPVDMAKVLHIPGPRWCRISSINSITVYVISTGTYLFYVL